jgi:dihydroneopterin aldolase
MSIHLRDVEIHAFHGVYEGEEKIGNPYIVNLEVKFEEKDSSFEDINGTINYVELFNIIKTRMQVNTLLLEKVCDSIVRHIRHQYPFIKEIDLSVYKLQAPIKNFQGKVGVSLNKKFYD